MNKSELLSAIADKASCSKKEAESVLDAIADVVGEALKKGEKVQMPGIGNFEAKERKARKGINPKTKEVIDIAACVVPSFKANKALKELMK